MSAPEAKLPAMQGLFAPTSIALVGASSRSAWARTIVDNLRAGGYDGEIRLVGRRVETVAGLRTVERISDLDIVPDVAFILMRAEHVFIALKEAADFGVTRFVVLAAGFGEEGPNGKAREREISAYCRERDLILLGPNNMGFVNVSGRVLGFGLAIPATPVGGISLISQSGALAYQIITHVPTRAVGLDHVITVGNEAGVDAAACIEYLIDQDSTRVICLYLHAIRSPRAFAAACRRAARAGKPVIAFKAGFGEQSARAAVAHTGGLVGDDRIIDAVLRQVGVIRCTSVEDLITTAALYEGYGELPGIRAAVIAGSGSSCEVFTDRADRLGLELPMIGAGTAEALRAAGLPSFATAQNPLDVTAAVTIDAEEILPELARILAEDPSVDILITQGIGLATPTHLNPDRRGIADAHLRLGASTSKPVLAFADIATDADPADMDLRLELGTPPVIESIDRGLLALRALDRWSRRRRQLLAEQELPSRPPDVEIPDERSWSEATARRVLSRFGFPFAPSTLVTSAADVGSAAAAHGYPLVAKICSPDIVHKSDIGGVILGLGDEDRARAAFGTLIERAHAHHPDARIEGVLIGPMRPAGVELIVGVTNDPDWGLVLALGLGGVWAEVLDDVALRPLPVTRDDASEMLSELRAAPLLDGARGTAPADRNAIIAAVMSFSRAAWAMRDQDLDMMESNPILVRGADVEALDVLVTFARTTQDSVS